MLDVHHDHACGAEQLVRLLLRQASQHRPDGLLVGIDSLVPAVAATLASDVGSAQGLRLVVHANRPAGPEPGWPCDSVGFDLAEVLARATSALQQLAAGRTVPRMARMRLVRSWQQADG